MPIVDISGLSDSETRQKRRIRERIQQLYHERLDVPVDATNVTFITDDTNPSDDVFARLYSKKFMRMPQDELDSLCDGVVLILEEEAKHDVHEAFPIPVLTMRGGSKPYRPGT